MSLISAPNETRDEAAPLAAQTEILDRIALRLLDAFGADFTLYDGASGDVVRQTNDAEGDPFLRGPVAQSVAQLASPQIVAEEDCLLLLAAPIPVAAEQRVVAIAPFATRRAQSSQEVESESRLLGVAPHAALKWINEQELWTADALLRLATAVLRQLAAERKAADLEVEVEKVSTNLANTYEEICLLYTLTQNLRISRTDEQLAASGLDALLECICAECVAVQLLPVADAEEVTYKFNTRTRSVFLHAGDCPLDQAQFAQLIEHLGLSSGDTPLVANQRITGDDDWPFPSVRSLIVVPLSEGANVFGWLAAFNRADECEFGTVEASLLSSIGAILGTHSGNLDLYRQQSEFLADVVYALTSAIDAKDPYTCGHSDRVARVAVRLAKELGWKGADLNTIYMAGLLHDIGKIGIDDVVLRKPGRLTDAEFEHIKLHPTLGHKILADIKQLASVLPAVLHHHEQWDGRGYPHKLSGEKIPLIARIVAVADGYDAMTSDRPYRAGMPVEKVNAIFREGSGKQWDAQVIAAYFSAYDDILAIANRERANLSLDVQQWT